MASAESKDSGSDSSVDAWGEAVDVMYSNEGGR